MILATAVDTATQEGLRWALILQSAGFVIAVVIIARMATEKRRPSNIFAWSLLLLFAPVFGVPLYLLFGGRKIRRLVGRKLEIQRLAARVAREEGISTGGLTRNIGVFKGNNVTLLRDGVTAYNALCEEIESATLTIHITTFILGRDGIAKEIVHRLAKRASEGVKVRLLIDAFGSLGQGGSFCRQLREAGGEVARFIPLIPLSTRTSANLRNHRKIALFDSQRAIVGGQNIDGRFLASYDNPNLFSDFSALIEGPAVGALTRLFVGDWVFASGQDINSFRDLFARVPESCGESELEVIGSGPDVEGDPLWERIITLVQEAQETITIVTPYFIPDEVLLHSLIIKAHRKRKVRIIVPERSNHPLVDLARNHYLRLLHSHGVDVLFYGPRMLHAKLVLVDDSFAVMGSANIDPRSLFVNFEIGLMHSSPADIQLYIEWLHQCILPGCAPYHEHPRSSNRRMRLIAEDLAHLMTPLL